MRQMWVVFFEELRRAWRSPGSYALMVLFFLVTGGIYLSVFFQASMEPQRYSPLQLFWELQWLPNLLWVPILTMRLLSVERKQGLLEAALATPTTPASIVCGKYLSALVLYLISWSSVALWVFITRVSALNHLELAFVLSPSAVWGGAIFCVISGALFLALGVWCSSLTRNSVIAAALTVCTMLMYMILPAIIGTSNFRKVDILSPLNHLDSLSAFAAGAVELSVVVAYLVGSAVLLLAAMLAIEQKAE